MCRRWQQCMVLIGIFILLHGLIACAIGGNPPGSAGNTPTTTNGANSPAATNIATSDPTVDSISTISFTISGGSAGTYTLHSTPTISKLRHGHKEFTIDLASNGKSIFLVFYGYTGPGSYTLVNGINGGDVRIDLGTQSTAWDLSLRPDASCQLTITSDTPSQYVGIDRMKGSFSCPALNSSHPDQEKKPITVSNGQIDVLIIVES